MTQPNKVGNIGILVLYCGEFVKNCTVLIFQMHIHYIFYFYCCGPFTLSESENAKATSLLGRFSGSSICCSHLAMANFEEKFRLRSV